mgnify:CR=1 FL=1
MIKFKLDEKTTQCAYLKTLYDLIEELNLRCKTYLDERYNRTLNMIERTRIVEIYGSEIMTTWLKLRMERYGHKIEAYNSKPEMQEER